MLKHIFKMAARNVLANKRTSILTTLGLGIGLACCLLIGVWIYYELSYDKFHTDIGRIHQVLAHGSHVKNNPSTPAPLAEVLTEEYPEIEYATRFGGLYSVLVSRVESEFYEPGIRAVDPCFFKIFSFPFVAGDRNIALDDLYSMVITEETARKYFGDEDPLGQTLTLNHKREFTVTGVIKDIPANSSIGFDILLPYEIRVIEARDELNYDLGWGTFSPQTFVKVGEISSLEDLNQKVAGTISEHAENEDAQISLMPFAQRYLFFTNTQRYIYVFSAVAIFVLAISCINFINLATASFSAKAKAISIRKINGAGRQTIVTQFLCESVLLSLLALAVALVLVELLFPVFNLITGRDLSFRIIGGSFLLPLAIFLAVFIGLVSGIYPALFLSSLKPIKVIGGELKHGLRGKFLRKVLVVVQFALSVFLIVGTIIIYRQLNFMKNKPMGYDREHIVSLEFQGDSRDSYAAFRSKMLRNYGVTSVSGCTAELPYFWWSARVADWPGRDEDTDVYAYFNLADYDFIKTLGIELLEGRDFDPEFGLDSTADYVINEKMAEMLDLEPVLGAKLTLMNKPGTVVGVVKDFHFQPLTRDIGPLFFMLDPSKVNNMLIRIRPGYIPTVLTDIRNSWEELLPGYPLQINFIDESARSTYGEIEGMGRLANGFTILALLISCLGLYGLSAFSAERRTKEIGIRKVLGATVSNIIVLISREFLFLVVLANLIAWPCAYLVMNRWLSNFAYRVDLGLLQFLLAGCVAAVIALMTVALQSFRAAATDPVKTLRYE
jgi:putative ABC transport system permease protein